MSISIRGGNGGGATSGASFSLPLTSWPVGAAPSTGDIVFVSGQMEATSAATWSQTAGTGAWTFQSTGDNNSTLGGIQSFAAWRVFDGSETAPTFTCTTSGRNQFVAIAVTPDAGFTIKVDTWATTLVDTTGSTSHSPNSAVAAISGEVSVLLNHLTATATGTTAITSGGETGWTSERSRSQAGTVGATYSQYIQVAFKTGVSGTVAPSAFTSNVNTVATIYHVLVTQTVVGADTASGADTGAQAAALTDPDTATGTDTATVGAAVLDSDTGAGTDTAAAAANLAGTDTAAMTDQASVAVPAPGTVTGSDGSLMTAGAADWPLKSAAASSHAPAVPAADEPTDTTAAADRTLMTVTASDSSP